MKRGITRCFWPFLLLILGWRAAVAQEASRLIITSLSAADFPLVSLNLITTDAQGAPLTDLSMLSLRENGIPIGDWEMSEVDVGVNVVFVVDANASSLDVDDDTGLTRLEKIGQSIGRYAGEYMGEGDKVSIVVADVDGGGRFLVEDATAPAAVIAALDAYDPGNVGPTPLNEMLLLALAHAADGRNDGRFQAVLLFTDGASLDRQLAFEDLVSQAQSLDLPLFAVIVGARADPNEIKNVARLYEPTFASYVHLADAGSADPIYAVWKNQRTQTQISYRSLQSSSGRFSVSVNTGTTRAVAELAITIAPPELTPAGGVATIRRVGDAPDTPLIALEPATYRLPVAVSWPDGHPRGLVAGNLFVDGQLQAAPPSLALDGDGDLFFFWDISGLEEGSHQLVVQVTDELGMTSVSDPLTIAIEVERPLPPTPTAAPTPVPVADKPAPENVPAQSLLLALLAGVGLVALLLLSRIRRRRTAPTQPDAADMNPFEADIDMPPPEPVALVPQATFLEVLEVAPGHVSWIRVDGDSVTIGRDHSVAQIIFDDPSVARLHARIRKRDDRYWLYDEGSAEGTFHNYQRLSLAPHPLEDQDTIHFGHVGLRFHLEQLNDDERPDD